MFSRKAVFLDRDGTLINAIYRPNFVKKVTCPYTYDELRFVPGVHKVLSYLYSEGFLRIMITNQPDVARGFMDVHEWYRIHERVVNFLDLDDYFMCRHTGEDNCPCRKPSPLMLKVAADKWGIDLSRSYMVGDSDKDIDAGKAAGCSTILIRTHYNQDVKNADYEIDSLASLQILLEAMKSDRK